jgi:hypothetical protein
MKEELVARVERLDKACFGKRTLAQLLSALRHQMDSMEKESTDVNVRKQIGDVQFVLVAMSRNMGWDIEELLTETLVRLENRRRDHHYYEAHVTIEPVFGDDHVRFDEICKRHKFRAATLLMQKRKQDTPQRSANDAFCTARSVSQSDLKDRMGALLADLRAAGFKVWRYKTESTLMDSRYDDSFFRLISKELPDKERNPRAPADGALPGRRRS